MNTQVLRTAALLVCCGVSLTATPAAAGEVNRTPPGVVISAQRDRQDQVERFTRTLELGATGELELSNIAGDISVEAAPGTRATIEVVKRARSVSGEEAKRQLDAVEVVIVERAGRAQVRTQYGRDQRQQHVSVGYLVKAPPGTRVSAKSISGSLEVSGIQGLLQLETVSGNVQVGSASRISTAKSVSGNVEIDAGTLEGDLTASSVSGNVRVRGVKTGSLNLGTVSGHVVLQDAACEHADLRSVSGNVQYGGRLARGGRYELRSHSGDLRLSLEGDVGFDLEASSFSGRVQTALPLTVRPSDEDARGRSRRHERSLRGVYGDGSARLALTTFSGNIVIERQ